MPLSILKYVDIARLVGAGIKCPLCNSADCRRSRWHAKQEKLGSAAFWPYRCNHCAHRFLASRSAARERTLINGAAALLLCFGVWVAGDLWLEGVDDPKGAPVALASAALPGAAISSSPTGALTGALTGGDGSAAGKDPATSAQKQQDAAENGDAGAMLQVGRDLATGNNRPKDVAQAAKWVQLAAATGHPEAMLELGRFYRDGLGVVQDSARAHAWFSRAVAAKHPDAAPEREALVRTMSREKLLEADQLSLPTQPAALLIRPK